VATVESALLRIAKALKEIKEGRLYRAHYNTFEDFVATELGKGREYGYRLVRCESVLTGLLEDGISAANLPDTERICRELARLDPKLRKNVWQRSLLMAEQAGKPVDAKLVDEVIDEQADEQDEPEKEHKRRRKHLKALVEEFDGVRTKVSVGVDFEGWDKVDLERFGTIVDDIMVRVGKIRERLKKHTGETKSPIIQP
jgi:hypothetical protein